MTQKNTNECRCSKTACGCATTGEARCTCGERCSCEKVCRCGEGCGCASKK
jgi:hypothetical protein